MGTRYDKGGSVVTDYSRSNMDPERAAKLNRAELDYVNGVWDETLGEWTWPSYPELAGKYDIPVRVINEQAAKHKWVSRRERRKTDMIRFQNEETRKRWLDEDREIMGVLMKNIQANVLTVSRLQDEHTRLIANAMKEEEQLRREGDMDTVVRVPIRSNEVEGIARTLATCMATAEKLAKRISGLPDVLDQPAPPTLILTVEEEEKEETAEVEQGHDLVGIEAVMTELLAIERKRAETPLIVYGEVEKDDDEFYERKNSKRHGEDEASA